MIKAIDAANFFITVLSEDEEKPTNKKVNKLLYFAQGHSFDRLKHALFAEDIQAWDHGPVVPEVYHSFKGCGYGAISEPTGTLPVFSDDEKELLLDVAREYGRLPSSELERMTHKPGTPWFNCYKEGVRNIVICKPAIEAFFAGKKLRSINDCIGVIPEIGYIDQDGYTVLPKEWQDEV